MTHSVFIEKNTELPWGSTAALAKPKISFKTRSAQTVAFAFMTSGTVAALTDYLTGKCVVKHLPTSDVLLLDGLLSVTGTGTSTRYNAVWTKETSDGAALRDFLGDDQLPKDCFMEVQWEDADGVHSVAFPIKLAPTFNEDDDGAPEPPDTPEALAWLGGLALLFSGPQSLTSEQRAQALANLGITIAADGKLTFHTGHSIYLDAPP